MKMPSSEATPLLAALLWINPASADHPSAWQQFKTYRAATNNAAEQVVDDAYLSDHLIANHREASNEVREHMLVMFAFPTWFARIDKHYEGVTDKGHCLTVNGYSDADEWLTASLLYVPVRGTLVLEDADIAFHEDKRDQPGSVQCPEDARVRFDDSGL